MAQRIITTLEITSSSINSVSGYCLNNTDVILCAEKVPLEKGIVVAGNIIDEDNVIENIKKLMGIVSLKLGRTISDVVLVLPSNGFEVFNHKQTSSVVSPVGIIAKIDIDNVKSQLSKASLNSNIGIVDIIPVSYITDNGQFVVPPLNQQSNSLSIEAKLHTLPVDVVKNYKRVVEQSGLKIKRLVVGSYAASNLLKKQNKVQGDYLLLDLGDTMTIATLASSKEGVVGSLGIQDGASSIDNYLIDKFKISAFEARAIKEMIGVDLRDCAFETNVFVSEDESQQISNKQLVESMKEAATMYFLKINTAIDNLLQSFEVSKNNFPVVFIGGGSKLNGFKELSNKNINGGNKEFPTINCVGARDIIFINCVGALDVVLSEKLLGDYETEDSDLLDISTRHTKLKRTNHTDDFEE
ncbi:MAG: hypothetical protein HUJ61_00650 [Bacilli bacterium]|nr:hypothetical protein [Bacilli bacterium]